MISEFQTPNEERMAVALPHRVQIIQKLSCAFVLGIDVHVLEIHLTSSKHVYIM